MLTDLQELWSVESVKWFVTFVVHFTFLIMGGYFGKLMFGK